MKKNGFTLIEILIAVVIIGILAAIAIRTIAPTKEARLVACAADLDAMNSLVQQTMEQTFPYIPDWSEIQGVAEGRWNKHFHYVPNNSDANKGHGNDLDICDEENPGASAANRDCLNIKYIIVCDHDHTGVAKYNALLDGYGPIVFGGDPNHEFTRSLTFWWGEKDPNLQKWIGR